MIEADGSAKSSRREGSPAGGCALAGGRCGRRHHLGLETVSESPSAMAPSSLSPGGAAVLGSVALQISPRAGGVAAGGGTLLGLETVSESPSGGATVPARDHGPRVRAALL